MHGQPHVRFGNTRVCTCYLVVTRMQTRANSPVWLLQAGLVLCDFFTQFHFNATRIHTNFQIYAIISGLTRFGIDEPRPHLSSVGGYKKMTSLSRHRSRVWICYVGDIIALLMLVSYSVAEAVLTNVNGKCKSTLLIAIQDKNRRKIIRCEEKLDLIRRLERTIDIGRNVTLSHISAYSSW